MSLKEFWNKKIEFDFSGILNRIKKWFKEIINLSSNTYYYRKRKSWPDKTTYIRRTAKPKTDIVFIKLDKGLDELDKGMDRIFNEIDRGFDNVDKAFDRVSKLEKRGTNETGPR